MAKAQFKAGDVVQLKSGGPKMTVNGPSTGNQQVINCSWFDKDEKLAHGDFITETLVKVDDAGGKQP
jgi:uncharacterized protein YodC (DUF2158 family)